MSRYFKYSKVLCISGNLVFPPFNFSFKDPFENHKLMGFLFSFFFPEDATLPSVLICSAAEISLSSNFWN